MAAGCGDDVTETSLLPSDFPGSGVDETNLADDGYAFTNNGGDVTSIPQVFRSTQNDDAIVTYTIYDGSRYSLFASYYNGSTFTPPTQILGAGQDQSEEPHDVRVLFLNTGSFNGASSNKGNVRARNRDAVILYVGTDTDDVASAEADERDANDRAYATYFDQSLASKAAEGTVAHGFQQVATPIDYDGVVEGADDEDVQAVGFVSDSLHGTHQFGGSMEGTLSGDPTTFVQLAFLKSPSTGTTAINERWFTIKLNLDQQGNALPVQNGATANALSPGVGMLENGDSVGSQLYVNDFWAIWQAYGVDSDGVDTVLTASVFNADTATATNLGSDPTSSMDSSFLPSADFIFGPDHGVGGLYVVFAENGFSDGNNGSRAPDTDLMIAQMDVASASRTLVEADLFKGVIDTTDTDADAYVVRTGFSGGVDNGAVALHRGGDFITIAFSQPTTDAGDLNPSSNTVGAPETNNVLHFQTIQTGRLANQLATSILATPVDAPALLSTGDAIGSSVDQDDVEDIQFQLGVPTGAAAVYGGRTDVDDAWQTNANRIFVRYTQYNDQNASGRVPNQVRLYTTGLEITAGGDGAAPTATGIRNQISQASVQFPGGGVGSDDYWGPSNDAFSAIVVDNGNRDGDVYTFFVSNDNHVADAMQTGIYQATRLYLWDGLTSTPVSSAGTVNGQPTNNQTVTSGPQAEIAGGHLHVFWNELAASSNSNAVLATRSWSARGTQITAVPLLDAAPSFIDLPSNGQLGMGFFVASAGSTVGVFFQENDHVYYNETRSDANGYRTAGGLANPTLVDNDSSSNVQSWALLLNDGSKPLTRSFLAYTKEDPSGDDERGFLRVHD